MEPPPGFPDTGAQNPVTQVFASVPDSLKGPLPPEFPDVNNQHRHERTEKAGNKEAAEQVQCLLHGLFYLGIEIPKPSEVDQGLSSRKDRKVCRNTSPARSASCFGSPVRSIKRKDHITSYTRTSIRKTDKFEEVIIGSISNVNSIN